MKLLSNAIAISDMFLDSGDIVSTVDRNNYKETDRATKGIEERNAVNQER